MAREEGNEEDYDCYDSFHWEALLIIGIRDYGSMLQEKSIVYLLGIITI
jgi:hypothetical protein